MSVPPADPQEMLAAAESYYAELAASGTPVRYTHRLPGDVQWRYNQWLVEACGPGELTALHPCSCPGIDSHPPARPALALLARPGIRRQVVAETGPRALLLPSPADVPAWPEWRFEMYEATGAARKDKGAAYRDLPLEGAVAAEAAARLEAARVRAQQASEFS